MPSLKLNRIVILVSAVIIVLLVLFALLRDNSRNITLQKANELLRNGQVKELVASSDYLFLKTASGIYKIPIELVDPEIFAHHKVVYDKTSNIILYIFIAVVFIGLGSILFRRWQKGVEKPTTAQPQKSKLKEEQPQQNEPIEAVKTDVTFDDIGGIEDVKEELQEIIDFMKNPQKYKRFGARLPRGVLLVGPPGVGKTMIAKAVANAAGVSFYYQSGASFVQIYVGMGAKRVHELFAAAKKNAPSIVFIDEIDAVGKKREGNRNDEREATLNQLLTEMDGFESQSGVIVIAATNKIEVLDPALLRAGRFDRRVFVDLPTKNERASILKKYLQNIPNDVDVEKIASITVGFNGAMLSSFVNEAALLALRQNDSKVTMEHFYGVKDKVVFGKKKMLVLNERQKRHRITYQTGKVLMATHFDLPFEKLLLSNERLTPPGQNLPLLQSELEQKIKTLLGGVVLCDIEYGEHASSAQNDIAEAKSLAKAMVMEYGMGSSIAAESNECEKILSQMYDETKELLLSFEEAVVKIKTLLEQNESITKSQVRAILDEVL